MARLLYSFDLKIGLSAHSSIASVYSETALSNCRDLHDASASSFAFLTVRIFLRVANAFLLSGSPLMAFHDSAVQNIIHVFRARNDQMNTHSQEY
mmetsp:Transcript_11034/g.24328  ORF Transcript_11034/g.24328 Transcript_11034/m.24328 type:complete len:95 (-) Transcript_11034:1077-1361(-)